MEGHLRIRPSITNYQEKAGMKYIVAYDKLGTAIYREEPHDLIELDYVANYTGEQAALFIAKEWAGPNAGIEYDTEQFGVKYYKVY